jgi:hypothetical protein
LAVMSVPLRMSLVCIYPKLNQQINDFFVKKHKENFAKNVNKVPFNT